jgi:site-specific recombinase XerD
LQSLTRFSEFLAQERPKTTAKAITRKLLLEYLSYLPKRVCIAVRKTDVIDVRAFLEIAARERWLPIGSERMIYDEEVPQPPKPQPRYIPSAVLDQLNRHLGNLKAPWMQMILIFQECGMRISELLQLPLDCLTQDARGTLSAVHARQDEARTRDPSVSGNRAGHTRTAANREGPAAVIHLAVP